MKDTKDVVDTRQHVKNIKSGIERLERHSATGRVGSPRKGGAAAGRGAWGRPGDEEDGSPVALDKNDPNYDEDDDRSTETMKAKPSPRSPTLKKVTVD